MSVTKIVQITYAIYSCFGKGCPKKAYKRTRQCRKVLWVLVAYSVLIEAARCFSVIEENSTNTCTHASLSFLLKPREPESNNDEQSLSLRLCKEYVGRIVNNASEFKFRRNFAFTCSPSLSPGVITWFEPAIR